MFPFVPESNFRKDESYLITPWNQPCPKEERWDFVKGYPTGSGASHVSQDALPVMSDGRQYTDYRPRYLIQLEHRKPMSGSHDTRQDMIHNASSIISKQRQSAYENVRVKGCPNKDKEVGTMLPEQDMFVCDKLSCERYDSSFPCKGLGTGRVYGNV